MLNDDFNQAMASLRAFYGAKSFSDPTEVATLSQFAKRLNRRDFDAVILEISLAHSERPTVAAICAACTAKAREIAQRSKAAANAEYTAAERVCGDCLGSGMICAVAREKPHYDYAFRCRCEAADRRGLSRDIPAWREDLSSTLLKASCIAAAHEQLRKEREA